MEEFPIRGPSPENALESELAGGFIYTELLVDALAEYENRRDLYPNFRDLYPKLLKALDKSN